MNYLKHVCLGIFLVLCSVASAQTFSDVSPTHRSYKSIEKTVKEGYLGLYSGENFRPNQAVSREQMARVIDKLTTKIEFDHLSFTTAEKKELLALSKSFKSYLAEHERQIDQLTLELNQTKAINSQLETLKTNQKNNFMLIIGSFILASVAVITG